MGLNLFHIVHAVGTVPSRLDLAYHSEYGVQCAAGNAERTKKAQANRIKILEYKEEEAEARHKGDMAAMKFKQTAKGRKAARRAAIAARVTANLRSVGA